MVPFRLLRLAAVGLLLCAFTCRGAAQEAPLSWGSTRPVGSADAAEVRDLVGSQIAALRGRDGESAYADAAPNVRRKFPSVAQFMSMVDDAYRPLTEARGLRFAPARGASATFTQGATFSESVNFLAADQAWTAVFGLERQPDGTLKITSCVLIPRQPGSA